MDFSSAAILCLGDLMLDRFAYCDTERISPEAPVPVLHLKATRRMLGGAGNVARNIASLGGRAVLMGLLGADAAGAEFRRLIEENPRLSGAPIIEGNRPTTCKTRYIAGHQQIVRIDEEVTGTLEPAEEAALVAALDRAVPGADAVILSDYAKGVLGPGLIAAVMARARDRGVPVYVDPKGTDFARYRGATCLTPNVRELGTAMRMPVDTEAQIVDAAKAAMRTAAVEAMLVTRSEKGMMLIEASGSVHVEAAHAREVFDVSGAGDTVIAALALALATGRDLPGAMHLANTAAGIAVSKLGTAAVELDELMLELSRDVGDKSWAGTKFFTTGEAAALVRRWKGRGLSVGFTNGCFDIMHAGHVALLAAARARCDRLVVALNSDDGVRRLKGPGRPVNGLADRSAVIAAVEAVDAVISFDADTPIDLIRLLRPDVLVKGGDWTIEGVVGAADVQAAGGRVLLVDLVEGRSTTRLIDMIRTGPTDGARRAASEAAEC
jgi:D-beta-D-heptose 7-phosphate kinase / D-beta-D-heptose 1-phosphate adenosyltransferase